MAIRRYEPWGILNELSRELNRFQQGGADADTSSLATSDWVPAVDIHEEQDRYLIEADLPGVRPEEIEIHMENGLLTIRGTRSSERKEAEKGYRRVERAMGTFYRRFNLPDSADADRISARSDHGVLEVTIPKQEKVQPRRIKVEG
ncbi:MAG TPA: Hsp20/alpha crystallin family protein [Gammaproteobacteria bacterium]|nr:Hsp20/alpha crystallin family protein [Gammaproteobacteria bacterium]